MGGLPTPWLFAGFVGLIALERLVELVISSANAAWARAQGGYEMGRRHYRYMVILHTGFLVAAPLEVVWLDRPFIPWLAGAGLAGVAASMGLRYWCIATLGRRWNTRVVVVPEMEVVNTGPYRFVRHPNYLAVIVELAALPLIHTAWITALVFSVANLGILAVRIRVEEAALTSLCRYDSRLGDRPRLNPLARGTGATDDDDRRRDTGRDSDDRPRAPGP